MKKFLSCILVLLLIPSLVFAREVTLKEFSYHNDDNIVDVNYAVTETLDGGYVTVLMNNHGYSVVKYDKTDKIVWEKLIETDGMANDVDIDEDDNIYVTGYTYGDDTVYYNYEVGFITKFDKNGKELETTIVGDGRDQSIVFNDLEIKGDKIVVVGNHQENMPSEADPVDRNEDYYDGDNFSAYSAIFNKDLVLLHDNLLDFFNVDDFKGVTFTSDGGYVAVGSTFSDNIPGAKPHNSHSYIAFIAKYDKEYKLEWVKGLDADSRLNRDNSCFYPRYDFFGYQDVIETCDGNYVAVGTVPRLTTTKILEEGSSRKRLEDMLGTSYNGLDIDYESDEYINYESNAAIIIKYDKTGKVLKEYYENGEYNDSYTDILELGNCDLLVTGNIGNINNVAPHSLGSRYENLGLDYNTCISGAFDVKLLVFNDKLEEVWSKKYDGELNELLLNVSPVGNNEFVAVGGFDSDEIGSAKFKEKDDNYADGLIIRLKMTYEITMEETKNGKFDAVNQHGVSDIVYHGDVATITTSPDVGYKVDTIKVVDSKGNEVPVTKIENNKYEYHITDDTWVIVTFKNVEVVIPPKTGVSTYLLLAVVVSVIGYVAYNLISKKNLFKKM